MRIKTLDAPPGRSFRQVFVMAYKELNYNDPLRLGAATAFFTIFSLPAILLVAVTALGIVFNKEIISGEIFKEIRDVVGEGATRQVKLVFRNMEDLVWNWVYTVVGFLFLIFIATTLFIVVQRSINQIWNVQVKEGQRALAHLRHRFTALLLILVSGSLVVAALVADVFLAFAWDWLQKSTPDYGVFVLVLLNQVITLGIIAVWFALLFRYLPDAWVPWRAIWFGAALTAVLFSVGKFILRQLLVNSNINSIYGAAGSVILLLLFIFYSSFILYYGAAFTKAYAEYAGLPFLVKPFAEEYEIRMVEK
jgi:membrane protein